jgi:hypothetical protein
VAAKRGAENSITEIQMPQLAITKSLPAIPVSYMELHWYAVNRSANREKKAAKLSVLGSLTTEIDECDVEPVPRCTVL